ncbi:receptor expression-enhancing protein 5-like isoform X1 [Chironomus tepperi]|uniref:receptor expression-enhancing protein 5-like isoform X1 n=1 Tax=Chironomus tepperi TaxID=113505 RepID=UPI00391F6821
MDKLDTYKQQLEKELADDSKPWTKYFKLLEEKTNLPKIYIFSGLVGFVALYLAFGYAAEILCNVIGIAYPAYISMKAVETKEKTDDTKWLTYWVIFATFSTVEFFSLYITRIIPFYWLIKCVFFIWCMAPIENNGSVVMYYKVIRPYFLKHESTVDNLLGNATDQLKKGAEGIFKKSN